MGVRRETNLENNEYYSVPSLSNAPGYQNLLAIWGNDSQLKKKKTFKIKNVFSFFCIFNSILKVVSKFLD